MISFMSTLHLIPIFFFSLFGTSSYLQLIKPISCTKSPNLRCLEVEREALLRFKYNLTDPSGRLSSWVGDDCCNWVGVSCDNKTGNVVKLDLRNPFPPIDFYDQYTFASNDTMEAQNQPCLGGKISSSLLDLKHLSYFDLSLNNFHGINIPKFLGSLESLRYLNLSFSLFVGVIPPHLWNLSRLQYLDLNSILISNNSNSFSSPRLEVESQEWVDGFPSLKYLGMNFVNLEKVQNWFHAVNMLPSLRELHLAGCGLVSLPHSVFSINFTLLSVLDLSYNHFNSFIPQWLSNVSGLSTIKIESSELKGAIPVGLGHLMNLRSLDLSDNMLTGEITKFVDALSQGFNSSLEYGNLPPMQELSLSYNQLNGTIPKSIGKLSRLVSLDLSKNSWECILTEAHFQNLTRLKSLGLYMEFSANWTLVLNVKQDWVPPFKLIDLELTYVRIGPTFPTWLTTQNELNYLILENVGISDTIPHGFWKSCPNVISWSLSHNKLHGQVPYFQFHPSAFRFDLSFNNLEGPFPLFHSNLRRIYLNNNMFSGPIPKNIGELLPKLRWLDLSSNSITGRIPHSFGMLKNLSFLVLRNNFLSGKLPPIWKDLRQLYILDLAENNISGNVPSSMQYLRSLEVLSLSQNHLDGEFPSFFRNYRNLQILDLGRNKFFGKLPTWLGESLPLLLRLRLRSNFFQGDIPQQLCLLSRLRILDLAHNDFSGVIPQCLGSLRSNWSGLYYAEYDYQMLLVSKGIEYGYGQTFFNLVYCIDLSSNNLSGEIPDNITSISELVFMNLSMNHLTGRIPNKIGNLQMLQSLDLSMNELYGPIPQSLSSLNFLSRLNLSFNNLSGKIPNGHQLQTLNDASIYEGNSLLCGLPLSTKCLEDETKPMVTPNGGNRVANENGSAGIKSFSFYISMIVGFIVGFWGVCGTLIIKTSWRQAYFRSFDNLKDKIVMFVIVKIVCLLRKESERN